jgi:hypothetical protein
MKELYIKTLELVYTPFLWYHGFYDTAVFILSVPMHYSATRRFFYLYIHKHKSHLSERLVIRSKCLEFL